MAKNQPQDVMALGSNGHADADFLRPLGHRMRNHSIHSHGGENESARLENTEMTVIVKRWAEMELIPDPDPSF